MASIVLSSLGGAFGAGFGGAIGGSIGQLAGSFLGKGADQYLFGQNKSVNTSGYRIKDLSVQSAAYGKAVPIVYGSAKLAGNIIWSTKIEEEVNNRSYTTGGKGAKVKHERTDYLYKVSLAIALCEGEVRPISKIWANDKLLDQTAYNITIYRGTEDQQPDPLIESCMDNAPAYKGVCYVVFEDLYLNEFHNRIPNFQFEVTKKTINYNDQDKVENMVNAITVIPGGGEFVYDTITQAKMAGDNTSDGRFIQRGASSALNQHNIAGKANALVSLDQLQETLPNVKWVAPVVNWFCSSLDIASAKIKPGVEYKSGAITKPDIWRVGQYNRSNAHAISHKDSKPIYGGTINDASIIRYLKECKKRGLKAMFYPMLFVDQANKPWRGRITGEAKDVRAFFNEYNKFVLHYAELVKDYADAFYYRL